MLSSCSRTFFTPLLAVLLAFVVAARLFLPRQELHRSGGGREAEAEIACRADDASPLCREIQRFRKASDPMQPEDARLSPDVEPSGDTCGTRRHGMYPNVPIRLARRFAVAAFAQDPDLRLRMLAVLREEVADRPRLLHRAILEEVRTALRAGRLEFAAQRLVELESLDPLVPPPCRADAEFYRGLVAARRQQTERALVFLRKAVELDPESFLARAALIQILHAQLGGPFPQARDCLTRAADFLDHLRGLYGLATDAPQLLELAETLAARRRRGATVELALAYAYAWGGATGEALSRAERVRDRVHELPPLCGALFAEAADRLESHLQRSGAQS